MGLFGNRDGGMMDEIRCDERDYLIWRWHPKGTSPTANQKATSIRWGSSLHVRDGSVAVFTCATEDGAVREYLEGPFDGLLDTSNLPLVANLIGKLYAGGTPFPAEVYFINLANLIHIQFGVPYFDIFDPRYPDYDFPVAVRGSFVFKISDYEDFIELHRLDGFGMGEFRTQVRDAVVRTVKQAVINATKADGIPAAQVEQHLDDINAAVGPRVASTLRSDFGVTVTRVDIAAVEIDKGSDGYKRLQAITQNKANMFTQAAGNILIAAGTGTVEVIGGAADAIGKGATGAVEGAAGALGDAAGAVGGVLGDAADAVGGALGDAADAVGSTIGDAAGAVGGALGDAAGAVGGALGGLFGAFGRPAGHASTAPVEAAPAASAQAGPPPIPMVKYYVAVDGEQTGPFTKKALEDLVAAGTLTTDSLVWTDGMANWAEAGTVNALAGLFASSGAVTPPALG